MEYDFRFRFGTAAHGGAQQSLDLPESLAWLWRDYDLKKTSQEFKIDPMEKEKRSFASPSPTATRGSEFLALAPVMIHSHPS